MADTTADTHGGEIEITSRPVGSPGKRSSGWYGVILLIVTEASLFVYLQFCYYYFLVWTDGHVLPPEMPKFTLSAPNTVILLLSSVTCWWAERGARRNVRWQQSVGLGISFVLGAVFMGIQYKEWMDKPFRLDTDSYGSLFFTVTGFHMAHVFVGLLVLAVLFVWSLLGYFNERRHAPLSIGIIYWHFVDVVWLTVFFTFYVSPYLG
jgi:heme/copper-type cytochrome/quinol oxidase subunit 3